MPSVLGLARYSSSVYDNASETSSGMGATTHVADGNLIIVYRGTANLQDVVQDVMLFTSNRQQFHDALAYARASIAEHQSETSRIYLTGHSLGGAQAKFVALMLRRSGIENTVTYGFNSPSISPGVWSGAASTLMFSPASTMRIARPRSSRAAGPVVNINLAGDPVSNIGVPLGHIITLGRPSGVVNTHGIDNLIGSLTNNAVAHLDAWRHAHGLGTPRNWSFWDFIRPSNR